jgi:predicted small secreted protein
MLLMFLNLGGCETMEGLGKDIQSLGDSIEDSVSDSDDNE